MQYVYEKERERVKRRERERNEPIICVKTYRKRGREKKPCYFMRRREKEKCKIRRGKRKKIERNHKLNISLYKLNSFILTLN